jgi:predicted permease
MVSLKQIAARVWAFLRTQDLDRDFDQELDAHVALVTEENLRHGIAPDEARRRALIRVGNPASLKEQHRELRGLPAVDAVFQDIWFAARRLINDRSFTVVAVCALAFAIGVTNTVYTIVNAMVLRGLPVRNPDRIVGLRDSADNIVPVSYRDLEDLRTATSFAGIAGYSAGSMTLQDAGFSPEAFIGSYVSANAFGLLEVVPILGRDFQLADDRPGAPPVVMLGYTIWTTRYGADTTIVGRTIIVNGRPATVIGVMPEAFRFPLVDEVWRPLAALPGLMDERRSRVLRAFGRLADGARMRQAQAELDTITTRLAREYPDTNQSFRPHVSPFTGTVNSRMFLALFWAVGFLLLIACANVATLLWARCAHRSREISIRTALGATRWRIVRQMLVESGLVALLAGILGLTLSLVGVQFFASAVDGINFPYWYRDRWTMDARVFVFLATVCVCMPLVFGLAPALYVSRSGNVHERLKDGGGTSGGFHAHRWTAGLLVFELASTLVLLTGASLMMRSFWALYRADSIVDASNILTTSMALTGPKYQAPEQRRALYQGLQERLGIIGTISSVTLTSAIPFIGGPLRELTIEGREAEGNHPPLSVNSVAIGLTYFETLGLQLLRGRTFNEIDGAPGHETAIVNQRLAAMVFPGEDPVGHRIMFRTANAQTPVPSWLTIVGVSPTVRQGFLTDLSPVVYVPHRSDTRAAWVMVRGPSDAAALTALLRQEMRALDPDLPFGSVMTLGELMTQSLWVHRVFARFLTIVAIGALLLSAIGLYSVTARSVLSRIPEIGVRLALGAKSGQVVWLFLRRGIVHIAAGLAFGLAGAFTMGSLVESLLFQTETADPVTLISVAALLVVVGVSASLWPAWRATRLDPVTALRYE